MAQDPKIIYKTTDPKVQKILDTANGVNMTPNVSEVEAKQVRDNMLKKQKNIVESSKKINDSTTSLKPKSNLKELTYAVTAPISSQSKPSSLDAATEFAKSLQKKAKDYKKSESISKQLKSRGENLIGSDARLGEGHGVIGAINNGVKNFRENTYTKEGREAAGLGGVDNLLTKIKNLINN